MLRFRSTVALGAAGLLTVTAAALAPLPGASAAPVVTAAPSCAAFDDPVYQVVKPSNKSNLLTPWKSEATSAAKYGFTQDNGVLFKASTTPQPGLVPVNRLYRGAPLQDFLFTTSSSEVESAGRIFTYKDQGASFYVSRSKAACLVPVQRYRKGGQHRLAVTAAAIKALTDAGWTFENVAFYAAPAGSTPAPAPAPAPAPTPTPPPATPGGAFKFAVIPDTQAEVLRASDPRMKNRMQYLAGQKVAFATQTGDLLNWDTPDHSQAVIAKGALDVLHNNGVPYTFAIGNHDTEATGVGGSARDATKTYQLQRDTSTVNSFWKTSDFGNIGGAYESGKIDNVYATYTAGGLKWMVLTLEFCARPGAVAWAKKVIAAHPDYNVIISTHSYMSSDGGIDQSDQGYGDTSGQQLFNQVVSQYPNVKMVFSGHVGLASRARVDTGKNGNKIYSFLTTMHDAKTNPVRMLEVNPAAGTIKATLYAPYTNYTWTAYNETVSGVTFVK